MGNFLKWSGRRLAIGWFWPLVLLALPNCVLPAYEYIDDSVFKPGDAPRTGAIMCDIPKVPDPTVGECATADDIQNGMSLGHGAVALSAGETNGIVLDWSDAALAECGGPKRIEYHDLFPDGTTVCLNCGSQITEVYKDANEACVAKCQDVIGAEGGEPAGGAKAFCEARAHVSVNFNPKVCVEGFCSFGGTPLGLPDPRRHPEDVKWIDLQNTNLEDNGFTLKFYQPVTGDFNAGAASEQLIPKGTDAWVEFEVGETDVSHAIGVRTSCDDVSLCPDDDGTLNDLPLVINLNYFQNEVNVVETVNGASTVIAGPYAPYKVGERFRIYVTDAHDGTADIAFSRLTDKCTPGLFCDETKFYLHPAGAGPKYPLRIDTSFRESNASFKNVTIMRIKQ